VSRGRATPRSFPARRDFSLADAQRNVNHVFVFNGTLVCREYEREFAQLRLGFSRGFPGRGAFAAALPRARASRYRRAVCCLQ